MALSSVARTLLVVAVVLMLLVGAGFAYLVWDFMQPDPRSEEQYVSYTLIVEPTDDLTNVSLRIPVPAGGDENLSAAVLAAARETFPSDATVDLFEDADGTWLVVEADSLPARWEERTPAQPVSTGDADGSTMDADGATTDADGSTTDATATATPRPVLSGYMVDLTVPVADRIDTRTPVGNESTLSPRLDPRATECFNERSSATCTAFDTRVRLDYDAAADTTVYVTTHVEGRNEWFAGGWTGNVYSQYLSTELTGPQSGWQLVSVYEETGLGSYRWPGGNVIVADAERRSGVYSPASSSGKSISPVDAAAWSDV